MNQPPSWPSNDQPPTWPSKNDQPPSWPSRDQPPSWPSGDQPPSWPSAGEQPDQGRPPSWPSSDQPPYQGQPPSPGPGYAYGYGPRWPRYRRRHPVRGAIIAIIALFILGSAIQAITNSHKSDSSGPSVNLAPSPAQTAAPGQVGSPFDLKDVSDNTYRVTLVKVIDPAKGGNQFTSPDTGKRFVGLVFTVKAVNGSPQSEDANNDTVVIGDDGQTYKASFDDIAGYTNFDQGTLHVAQGDTQTGAVTVEVPDGVKLAKVQWTSQSGYGSIVQWIISS